MKTSDKIPLVRFDHACTNKPDGRNNKKGVQSHLFMEPTLFFPINIEESEKICRNQMNFSTYTIFYFMGTKGLTSMAQLFFVSILLWFHEISLQVMPEFLKIRKPSF